MTKRWMAFAAGLLAFALAGCAQPPVTATTDVTEPDDSAAGSYKACLITDAGSASDGSGACDGNDHSAAAVATATETAINRAFMRCIQGRLNMATGAWPAIPRGVALVASRLQACSRAGCLATDVLSVNPSVFEAK